MGFEHNAKQRPMQGPRRNVACDDRVIYLEWAVSAIQYLHLWPSLTDSLAVFHVTWQKLADVHTYSQTVSESQKAIM